MTDGLLVVDKPAGPTSHDVVAVVRRSLGQRRVGHAGTLDPDATGVLLIGVGRATRLLRFASDLPKRYIGELVLGVATSTLDASGEVTGRWDMDGVEPADVRRAVASLTGPIMQVPPMVSAVKVGGRRLHELARKGIEVERPARPVTVHSFTVEPTGEAGVHRFEVECSSGTYVRTLVADLGTRLGGGAHLRLLRRTAVGPQSVEGAVALADAGPESLRPARDLVAHLEAVDVDDEAATAVGHGRRLQRPPEASGPGPWAVLSGGRLIAVYEADGPDSMRAAVVLEPAAGGSPTGPE
ncbi:MAG TPA: tRNA pseudouridine(55) synthase TruB [Acidimicrobiales bacterium]|nr:tRNA pseudouridine(55) synthase TruB [Acidimicrobiales bacterium]